MPVNFIDRFNQPMRGTVAYFKGDVLTGKSLNLTDEDIELLKMHTLNSFEIDTNAETPEKYYGENFVFLDDEDDEDDEDYV